MKHLKSTAYLIGKFFLLTSCLALVLTATNPGPGLTQSPEVRKLRPRAFKDMPLAIKEVRNLQKERDWFRDLEIEVKNVSEKPIYFISLVLEFPGIGAPPPEMRSDGSTPARSTTGFRLTYGATRLMDVSNLATPEDAPLRPGETYVFKMPESRVTGLEHMKREKDLPPQATDRIDIEFDIISFGDGTGFIVGEKRAYPKKKDDGELRRAE